MRAFLLNALEAGGYEVGTARSGFEALKVLQRERFHLIITDINMPDINGLELVRFIRDSPGQRETPLIIVSSDGRDRDRERGLKLGANAYLVKPFRPEELLEAARRCLAESGGCPS